MKVLKYIVIIAFLLFIPNVVDASEISKVCKYSNERILAYINIYDDGVVKSEGFLVKDGVTSGQYHSETKIGNSYTDVANCPKYILATYGRDGASLAKYYVANNKQDLEKITKDKKFKMVDFANYELMDAINGGFVISTIIDLEVEASQNDESTKKCSYNTEIVGCSNCEISIEFWKNGTYYDVGESVVRDYSHSNNITGINFIGDEWKKREFNTSLKQTVTPFQEYLGYNLCPEDLVFKYDENSKKLDIYVNESAYKQNASSGSNTSGNNNYVGGEEVYGCEVIPIEIRNWINDALNLLKYVALVLVIVLGVLDFIKAAGSGKAEAMKKAGQDFLKRIIAVIILFLLPVIVDLVLNLIEIYGADSTCLPE